MEYRKALEKADTIKEALEQTKVFERVEIAGSIRRKKSSVGDIEIVAASKYVQVMDMFGEPKGYLANSNFLTNLLGVVGGESYIKNGDRYKQILLNCGEKLDLFLVYPPSKWGVIFTIRTGPWQFSKAIVTKQHHGGLLNNNCEIKDGALWENNRLIDTPEEQDFFDYLVIDYVNPEKRRV